MRCTKIWVTLALVAGAFASQAQESTPPSHVAPSTVKSNSATRPINTRSEQATAQLRSNKSASEALDAELGKAKPFASGVPRAVKQLGLQTQATPAATVPTWDLKDAWSAWCDANWDQTCEGFETWNPPANWDICRFNVVEESKAHGEWAVVAADAKKVTVRLKSWGSHAFFDRWGGWVRVKLQTVQLVPSSATPEQRQTLACSYGNGGGSGGQGLSEYLFCAADPTDPSGSFGIQMCADYVYENGVKKYIRGPYACGVCFRQ